MKQNEKSDTGRGCFREYLLGGISGGTGAGILTAYLELLFLLFTIGPFWVDLQLSIEAFVLYGLLGGVGGGLGSVIFFICFFNRHPLRKIRPWVFFFAFLSASGLALEIIIFLLDIHTFRDANGKWTVTAYIVLFLGLLASGFAGWAFGTICRRLFPEKIRRHWRLAGTALAIFIVVFLLAGGWNTWRAGTTAGKSAPGEKPMRTNVIILLVDAMRADHLSAYGYPLPTSPVIDRLARAGVLFRNCYATSTWTVPTHASLFTGLYPSTHGCYSLYSQLDPDIPTLAQILAGQGYRTGSFYNNPLLGSRYGLLRGFQTALGVDDEHKVSLMIMRIWERLRGDRSVSKSILLTAGKWIEQACNGRKPFFLFVNLLDAHLPYRPKKPYIDDFLRSLPAEKVNFRLARKFTTDGVISKKNADALYPLLTAADWRWLERFYDSNIRAIDDQIGIFLKRLQSKGMLEDTLVVVTADHGESIGENGVGGHYHPFMPAAALRIPLIFWFPKRLAGGEISQPVSQVDIFSNILKLAGLDAAIPRAAQATNLLAPPPDREILAEFWDETLQRFTRAFYYENRKLLLLSSGKKELYELTTDHLEKNDLAGENPDLIRMLMTRLDRMLRSMPRKKSLAAERNKKEMEKRLKSLGYL